MEKELVMQGARGAIWVESEANAMAMRVREETHGTGKRLFLF